MQSARVYPFGIHTSETDRPVSLSFASALAHRVRVEINMVLKKAHDRLTVFGCVATEIDDREQIVNRVRSLVLFGFFEFRHYRHRVDLEWKHRSIPDSSD